jgi:hypothetical protein
MSVIRFHDAKGSYCDLEVKDFEELTIADWYTIAHPPIEQGLDEMEANYLIIERWTGIAPDVLRTWRPSSVEQLMMALGKLLGDATKARLDEWTPDKTFTWNGITYTVPQVIEADTTFGQWADLNARLENLTADADMLPVICAVLLVEEGKSYDGTLLDERVASFRSMPVHYALKLTAFFFASGSRLQDVTSHYMNKRLSSALQALQPVLNELSSATAGSAPSTGSPS